MDIEIHRLQLSIINESLSDDINNTELILEKIFYSNLIDKNV